MDTPMCKVLGLIILLVVLLIVVKKSEYMDDPNSDPLESKFASKLY